MGTESVSGEKWQKTNQGKRKQAETEKQRGRKRERERVRCCIALIRCTEKKTDWVSEKGTEEEGEGGVWGCCDLIHDIYHALICPHMCVVKYAFDTRYREHNLLLAVQMKQLNLYSVLRSKPNLNSPHLPRFSSSTSLLSASRASSLWRQCVSKPLTNSFTPSISPSMLFSPAPSFALPSPLSNSRNSLRL